MSVPNRQITLPPFWVDNVPGWFEHLEVQFEAKKISEKRDSFAFTFAALRKELI
jgi:hypothetical protein